MREIKFRAFVDNKMYKVVGLDLWSDSVSEHTFTIWDDDLDDSIELDATEFELMQYTGLKDKNGKEIYERDIITCSNGMAYQYEVEFVFGCFLGHDKATGFSKKLYDMKDLEVVGNIYENPELLEVIK